MSTRSITNERTMGRPRLFTDEEAFTAVTRAIKEYGYAQVSMGAIAKDLGCTAPALMSRFGSKGGLFRAFMEWGNTLSKQHFDRVKEAHTSPIDALRARFSSIETDTSHEFGTNFNHLEIVAFHVAAWSDPNLHDLERDRREMFTSEIVGMLEQSLQRGELVGCVPQKLGWALMAAIAGVALQWNCNPAPMPGCEIVAAIDELLKPYLVDQISV